MSEICITQIPGVKVFTYDIKEDNRGYFKKIIDKEQVNKFNPKIELNSVAISSSKIKGTLRGLHFQMRPFGEEKIISCIQGSIFDVVVDLRSESSTYGDWSSIQLQDHSSQLLILPQGIAHGYQTLSDDVKVFYALSSRFNQISAKTISFEDPELNISWPIPITNISEKDQSGISLSDAKIIWNSMIL